MSFQHGNLVVLTFRSSIPTVDHINFVPDEMGLELDLRKGIWQTKHMGRPCKIGESRSISRGDDDGVVIGVFDRTNMDHLQALARAVWRSVPRNSEEFVEETD